jgi:aerobic-type carbon monoxide dehydrogenase small subunit (CoxS/CutS family)
MSRHDVTVTVNREQRRASVEARKLLVQVLREDLGVPVPMSDATPPNAARAPCTWTAAQ